VRALMNNRAAISGFDRPSRANRAACHSCATARQAHGARQPEPTGDLSRNHCTRQLEQTQRIAPRLGDDPIKYAVVHWPRQSGIQQGSCV
jgi:hypothetical protein